MIIKLDATVTYKNLIPSLVHMNENSRLRRKGKSLIF